MRYKPMLNFGIGMAVALLLLFTVVIPQVDAYVQGSAAKSLTYMPLPLVMKLNATGRSGYAYEVTNFGYNAYFKTDSNTAEAVRFEKNGYFFTYDLSGGAMQWAVLDGQPNAKNTLGSGMTSNSQSTAVSVLGNVATYSNAFYNTTVTYTMTSDMLKENFVLLAFNRTSMKNYTYLEYSGNIKFNSSLNICTDSQCFTPSGTQDDFETSGAIYFKNSTNSTIFFLPAPTVTDANGNVIKALYSVHGSNAAMNFWLRINKTFLENAKYPVTIDPTVMVDLGSQDLKGIAYTPQCIAECHLPFAVSYTGTGEPSSITLNPSSKTNINWFFNKLNVSDSMNISDIRYLQNITRIETIITENYVNNTYAIGGANNGCRSENATNICPNSNCYMTNATHFNCTELSSYSSQDVNVSDTRWTSIYSSSFTMYKDVAYYFDYVGYRKPKIGAISTDIIPSIDGINMSELAWWNSTYRNCTTVTANQNNTNDTMVRIPISTSYSSDGKDFAILEGTCSEPIGSPLNFYRPFYNASSNPVTLLYVRTNSTFNDKFALYFNNTATPPDYSNITLAFPSTYANRTANFNNETIGSVPAGWSTTTIHVNQSASYLDYKFGNVTGTGNYLQYMSFPSSGGYTGRIVWGFLTRLSGIPASEASVWVGYQSASESVIGFRSNSTIWCDEPRSDSINYTINTDYWFEVNQTMTSGQIGMFYNGQSLPNCQSKDIRTSAMTYPIQLQVNSNYLYVDSFIYFKTTAASTTWTFSGLSGVTNVSVTIQSPTNITYGTSSVSLNFVASVTGVLDKCWYSLNGGANILLPSCANTTLSSLPVGTNNLTVYVNDTSSIIGSSAVNFTIDNTPPVITEVLPTLTNGTVTPKNYLYYNITSVDLTANISSCVIQFNGVNSTMSMNATGKSVHCYINMTGLADGTYIYKYFSNDTLNNTAFTAAATHYVDATLPVIAIQSPTNSTYNFTNISLSYTITDTTAVNCIRQLNGLNSSVSGCQNQTFSATEGINNVKIFANDTANNTNVSSVNFFVDSTSPVVSIQSPTNITYGSTSVNMNFTVTKTAGTIDKCWYVLDGSGSISLPSCANVTLTSLSKTTHVLTIFTNKTTSNQNSSNINFSVDSTNPTITMQSPLLPPDNTYNTNNISLSYTASDLFLDTCVRQLDGVNTTITPKCANQTMTLLSEGTHFVKVFVNDTVNNTNATELRTFNVDTLAPLIDIQSPVDGASYNTFNITLNFTLIHLSGTVDKCWYKLNGGSNVSLPSCQNITFTAANNSNTIIVYANDTANNIGNHTHVFFVDVTAPVVAITSPLNATYYANSTLPLTFTASDSNGVTCMYRINGSAYTSIPSCNNITLTGLTQGFFTLDLNATDGLNNSGITEVNFTVFHGVNLSTFYPNLSSVLSWNLTASNSTSTISFNNLNNSALIWWSSLPQGLVNFTASLASLDNETWYNVTVSSSMGIQQHNFTLYPISTISFYDTKTFTLLSDWIVWTVPTYFNATVSGTSYSFSNRFFPSGPVTFYGSKTGYLTNSTSFSFDNSTFYNIILNTSQARIFMYAVDEIQTGQKIPFNSQFILVSNNVSVFGASAYRWAGNNASCLWDSTDGVDNTCYTNGFQSCGSPCVTSPSTDTLQNIQAFDQNIATFNMSISYVKNGVSACGQSFYVDVERNDGGWDRIYDQGFQFLATQNISTILSIDNRNLTYPKAAKINLTIFTVYSTNCGPNEITVNEFRLLTPYEYVDNNTIAINSAGFSNFSVTNLYIRGEETYQRNYTQQRMYRITLSQNSDFNLISYLLRDTGNNGFTQFFTVVDPNNIPIPNALITLGRWYGTGVEKTVAQCESNVGGSCSIWMQGNQPAYSFLIQKSGYQTNYTQSVLFNGNPANAYVYMKSGTTVNFTSIFYNMLESLTPTDIYQNNATDVSCQIIAGDGNLNFMNLTAYQTLNTTITSFYNSSFTNSAPSGTTLTVGLNNNGRFDVFCTYEWVSNATGSTITYQNVAQRTFWIYSDRLRDAANQTGNDFGGIAGIILAIGIILIIAGPIAFYSPSYGLAVGLFLLLIFMWLGMVPWYVGGLAIITGISVLILRGGL